MVGCAPVPYQVQKPTVQHQYELLVVDIDGNPLEGVKIEYRLRNAAIFPDSRTKHLPPFGLPYKSDGLESGSYTTTSDGIMVKNYDVTSNPKYPPGYWYESRLDFKATKDGYYPNSGSLWLLPTRLLPDQRKIDKITLIRPIDYFNKEFASTISDANLKTRVLRFIDLIKLQGLVAESVLETRSINSISFKGNNYLQFKFTNVNEYNSLKLNKYDIGKTLFDEVIRKVLSPLNEFIGNANLFYGYDLTVVGATKSFADKDASAKRIEYRFMIPESVVRKYKNKDISGQQVLDESVILMDDERVELKLQ